MISRADVVHMFLLAGVILGCQKETSMDAYSVTEVPIITSDEALKTARIDAERAYRNLSEYRALVSLEKDGWHVDYALKDSTSQGGGAHYVIDQKSGAIVVRRYEQ